MNNELLKLTIVRPPSTEPVRSMGIFENPSSPEMRSAVMGFLEKAADLLPPPITDPEVLAELKAQEVRTMTEGRLVAVAKHHENGLVSLVYRLPDEQ